MPRTRKTTAAKHSDAQIMQFTGQQYGQQAKQIAAQRALPATPPPAPGPPGNVAAGGGGTPAPGPDPGSLGDLFGPTARPDEPLTAGMPFGPGPGAEAVRSAPGDPDLDLLRRVFQAHPDTALGRIIAQLEGG